MKDKPRIVVVEFANGGGLIHFVYQLCNALANEEMDVTLIAGTEYELDDLPHNFSVKKMLRLWKGFDAQPIHVLTSNPLEYRLKKFFFFFRRVFRGFRLVLSWIQLTLYLTRVKPDIIQFSRFEHFFEVFFIAYLRFRGLVLVQVCHEFEARERQGRFSKLFPSLDVVAYTQFSAIFFLAQEMRQRFLSLFPSIPETRTYAIPHGNSNWLLNFQPRAGKIEELRSKYGLQTGEKVVLFFGLLAPSKGLEDLVEAFALVRKVCAAKLLIAGYPTKHINIDALKTRIDLLGLNDSIILDMRYIPVEEIGLVMSLACVVMYPYRSGTQSGALQTAYTFGRPVIATSVGGLPEVVDDGKSGYLVPAQSPNDLAEKIIKLVDNPEKAAEMGRYAQNLSNTRFSWEVVAKQVEVVYRGLL